MTNGHEANPLRDTRDRRITRIAGPSALVFFGVTGDLARKKLLPAVYDLMNRGLLPPSFGLVGFGRRPWSDDDFRAYVRESVEANARTPFREDVWNQFQQGMRFVVGAFDDDAAYEQLKSTLAELDERGAHGNHAFYLSIPPKAFEQVLTKLAEHDLASRDNDTINPVDGWRRVVIEKPFGHNLESARELNSIVEAVFPPDAVFRIDHYLGKETVQNILAMRFSNQMFEPLWNSNYVDHVQITMAEDIGIGSRAGYYDGVGAARDVIQNHLLQLLALTAMEEPLSLDAKHLRAEKAKVLEALRIDDLPNSFALGQYAAGYQGGEHVNGIAVVFKKSSDRLFGERENPQVGQNAIVIRVQPDEGMTIRFSAKVPGTQMEIRDVNMDFGYGHSFTEESPEAYERLILDVLLGEPPLFPRHEEVELSWKILDPFEEYWEENRIKPEPYESGSWGPRSAHEMLERDNRAWRRP